MKTTLLLVIGLLTVAACQQKEKANDSSKPVALSFNNFVIGTPADTIQYRLRFGPTRTEGDKMKYDDVTFETVRGNVEYKVPGGRLVGARFTNFQQDTAVYTVIYKRFVAKFGQPTYVKKRTAAWETEKDALYLDGAVGAAVFYDVKDTPEPMYSRIKDL
ncbi:hypothetical protein [Larkinella knui]|uniref:Uncharacterized protein n=1 Tax=Larkinella knui TaxID=2025310 RepID=A0A3P1CJA7_9BACT|nr:hypothetical protein [Larkinella knui]RRB13441.1 hypothetical protein EHT87_14285 [Larkinella knui]